LDGNSVEKLSIIYSETRMFVENLNARRRVMDPLISKFKKVNKETNKMFVS